MNYVINPILNKKHFDAFLKNYEKSAAKIGGFAPATRQNGLSRSSPTGFDENLHPPGSIFNKNLDNPAKPA